MLEQSTIDSAVGRREVLNELQEGLWVADSQGRIAFANPALARMLGFDSPDELVGRPWRELVPAAETARLARTKPGENTITTNATLTGKGNRQVPAQVTVIRRPVGRIQLQVGLAVAAPALAPAAEAGVADSTWRQVMENSVDGICIVEQGKTVFANHRLEELVGYTASQIEHFGLDRLIAVRDRRSIAQLMTQPARLLTPVHHEVTVVHRSGTELECEMRIVPITTKGQPALLVFIRDVSQLKQAERSRNEVVAMLSHDLRTPLAAIKEAMSLLAETAATRLDDRQRRYLIIAREEIDRLNRMIDNLVESTRMDAGKVVLRLDSVDLATLLSSSIESLSLLVNKRNLSIERNIPARMPPVLGDRDRLLRVLNNLLDNAIKYSPVGGTIRIEIGFVEPNDPMLAGAGILPNTGYVQLTISDEGPGIPAEFLDRVFGKFERVDPHGPGIGLGLAIVKSIIEMHHGTVWALSKLGEGARFSFILPIKETN
jgi:PAS domain S-box-containing protein